MIDAVLAEGAARQTSSVKLTKFSAAAPCELETTSNTASSPRDMTQLAVRGNQMEDLSAGDLPCKVALPPHRRRPFLPAVSHTAAVES